MIYLIRNIKTGEWHKRGYAGYEWKTMPHQSWQTGDYKRAVEELESVGFDTGEIVLFGIENVIPVEQSIQDQKRYVCKLLEEYVPYEEAAKRDIDAMSQKDYKKWKEIRIKLKSQDAFPG